MKQDLTGKILVITGAGGGIGRAIALRLAQCGMRLALLGGNNLAKLEATRQLVSRHTECLAIPGNLTDLTQLDNMVARAVSAFGGVDVLVNNAGAAQNTPFADVTPQEYDSIMDINVRTPFFLTQKCLPYLRKSSAASIINLASVTSHAGYPLQSAYSASKHALLGFTKSLAAECYRDNIRVHAIAPGGVYTDMVKLSRPDLTPDGMILPEEIADIVLFLLENRGNAVVDEILVHRVNKQPFLV
ncbi:MAG: SDR family oxidoreductase [Victivallales bacterium]|nr:SDR family oxidoreductase [Victivallales bacterium]